MNTKKQTIKKHAFALIIGGFILFGLPASGIFNFAGISLQNSSVMAQEKSDENNDFDFVCTNRTLSGKFASVGDGYVTAGAPPAALVPFATVNLFNFDGMGNVTNKVTRSINGQISRGTDTGTYQINSDCTGTITIATPNPPFQLTFDIVISDLDFPLRGGGFYYIATTPGGAVTGTAKKVQ